MMNYQNNKIKPAQKFTATLRIMRPINFFIVILSVAIASVICMEAVYSVLSIVAAALSAAFTASAGNVVNDIFDKDIDKLNRPERPLPANIFSLNYAKTLYASLILISVGLAFYVNITALIVVLIAHVILFFYSYKFKTVILLGNFIVAVMTGVSFLYGGIAVGNVKNAVIPAVFAFIINGMREIVKDMEDVKGDSVNNVYTFPQKKGYLVTKYLILVLGLILIVATVIPFILSLYRIEYFIIVMAVVNPVTVYSIKKLFKDHSQKSLKQISSLLKLNMVFGLAAIFLGK